MSLNQNKPLFYENASPGYKLWVLFFIIIAALLVLSSVLFLISSSMGVPFGEADTEKLFTEHPGLLRLTVVLQHLLLFIITPVIFIYLFFGRKFFEYLSVSPVRSTDIWYFLGWLFCLYPFMSVVALWMSFLPLPEWMMMMDEDYSETLSGVLKMEHFGDLMVSLLIAAVLPGLGEELLFRGIIQKELSRLFVNPHLAIWLTAFVFSILHFQVTGFFPKMMIGLVLGYAYFFTKNFWIPVILHMMNNAFATIALYNAELPEKSVESVLSYDSGQMIIFAAFGFASVAYYQMLQAKYRPKTNING